MRTRGLVLGILSSAIALGCGAELGGGGGVEARTGHAVGFGRLAAATKVGTPLNDHGLLVGASVESRAEEEVGSRWVTGVMVGWGNGPAAIDGTLGWEAYGEFGTPIHEIIFRRFDFYTGAAVAFPIRLGSARRVTDLNESTWILTRRFELVPLFRGRVHVDHPENADAIARWDLAAGLTFRLRIFTDLF